MNKREIYMKYGGAILFFIFLIGLAGILFIDFDDHEEKQDTIVNYWKMERECVEFAERKLNMVYPWCIPDGEDCLCLDGNKLEFFKIIRLN